MAIRLFEESVHASAYAQFRPHYNARIRDIIKSFMEKHGCGFECIVDVATGSGQALAYWTDVFRKCIGMDISSEQIKNARKTFQEKGVKNVEFHVCPADDLSIGPSSCDLVTCAQAWHWLDAEKLYKEATRVLRKPGVVAVYGYGIPYFPSSKKATDVTLKFHNVTLAKHWHGNRGHIINHYKEVKLPYSVTERYDITQEWPIPLSHYMGYLGTWSGYCKCKNDNPGDDPLVEVHQDLKEAFTVADTDPIVDCTFPIFVILGANLPD